MASKDDGGWAFPTESDKNWHHGMTLRDWFAGLALSGMLSREIELRSGASIKEHQTAMALVAYDFADAMLEARDGD